MMRKKLPFTSSYRNATSRAFWRIFWGGPMRGTPGGWHCSTVSVWTWRSLKSLTLARNSGLYFGKLGAAGAAVAAAAPPRPSRAPGGGLLPPRGGAAVAAGGQPSTQTEPSGSVCGRTKPIPPPWSHVPFRSGRPSAKCGAGFGGACALTSEAIAYAAKNTATVTTMQCKKRFFIAHSLMQPLLDRTSAAQGIVVAVGVSDFRNPPQVFCPILGRNHQNGDELARHAHYGLSAQTCLAHHRGRQCLQYPCRHRSVRFFHVEIHIDVGVHPLQLRDGSLQSERFRRVELACNRVMGEYSGRGHQQRGQNR